jgi:hypothetical protein
VLAERFAGTESRSFVEPSSRSEGFCGAGFQTYSLVAQRGRCGQQVVKHGATNPFVSCFLAGVHRLQLGVGWVESPERGHAEQHSFAAGAVEGDGWVGEGGRTEGVDVDGGSDLPGKGEVPLDQSADIGGARVVNGDN